MRAVRLNVKGFGPYVEEQEVDFRQLQDAALYLITGPTGSGKTTLLDAICFGLYGDTSGGGRDGRQMRSDFLQPSQITEITFDFDIGRESYRVRRTPAQVRPRRRGTGNTEEPATAALWRRTGISDLNNDGEVLASHPTTVTEKVRELLGFECGQFRQVVLLPQGEFRKFLSATSREREQILEVLFQTETFRHLEEELKAKAKSIEEEIRGARQRIANFLEAAQAESEDGLRQRLEASQQHLGEIEGELNAARQSEAASQQALETARTTAEKLAELESAETALSAVQSRRAVAETTQKTALAARRAEQLIDLERLVHTRLQEHAEAESNCAAKLQELQNAERAEFASRERFEVEEARQDQRAQAAHTAQHLSGLRERVEKISLAATELGSAEEQNEQVAAEVSQLEHEVDSLHSLISEGGRQISALQASAQRAEILSLTEQQSVVALQNRRRLDQVNSEFSVTSRRFANADATLQQKSLALQKARHRRDQMQADWIAAQAAVLASTLTTGHPCPVCGSTEHPSPASSEVTLADEHDLKESQAYINELEIQIEAQRSLTENFKSEMVRLETEATGLSAQLCEAAETTVTELEGQLAKTRQALGEARIAGERTSRLEAAQARDRLTHINCLDSLTGAKSRHQSASNRVAAARQALSERQDGIPESLRTVHLLNAAIKQASDQLKSLTETYEGARKALEEAKREVAGCVSAHEAAATATTTATERARGIQGQFTDRLKDLGFSGLSDFDSAKAAIPHLQDMDKLVREFEKDLVAAQSRFARAQQTAVRLEAPDLQKVESDLQTAKEVVAALLSDQHRFAETGKAAERSLSQIQQARESLQALEAAHSVFGKIAEVACGNNQMRITFQRFVQGTLFEDVLQAASIRLRKMSKGRFELQRALRAVDGRQSGGLDIVVLDSHTGTTRPVSSLSGGEGFMASLSLALGLADVVQNHSGGVRLGSLFIDEGFGSLDAEALDQALQVLTELRQGGRSIGIISHVSELKERINTRIEVIPQGRGSVARIVGGIKSWSK